ncbi:hypothetical protein I3271_07045 [Photobacterium leiognathi]|uniref:hypothetical protein n=1 Tax=Photobacterium leiognathi TaxID=553611 RepID=UPI001EE05D4E|nr:hypothetical protein [Photobacterium leiognathi]MCG3884442.1 hypothetical protein [Photobacterium leiognathi]
MPIAIKLGVYCKPLAWERLDRKLYRAEHICMAEEIDSESGSKLSMSGMGTRFMTDDESPERALALTCIKVLQDLKISKRKKVLPSDYD